MQTRTKFVFLMHPYEFKRIKANTGRLTHLCLKDSELHIGETFDEHEAVQAVINDPENYPVLLYPGREALNLSDCSGGNTQLSTFSTQLGPRRLVVFLLDGTWRLVRPMLRLSRSLQRLPRVMFTAAAPSRYVIKQQPEPGCLSTLEATHELLVALDRAGLDRYAQPEQLLGLFQRMQDFQLGCTAESKRLGLRRHAPKPPRETPFVPTPPGSKRRRIFPAGQAGKTQSS